MPGSEIFITYSGGDTSDEDESSESSESEEAAPKRKMRKKDDAGEACDIDTAATVEKPARGTRARVSRTKVVPGALPALEAPDDQVTVAQPRLQTVVDDDGDIDPDSGHVSVTPDQQQVESASLLEQTLVPAEMPSPSTAATSLPLDPDPALLLPSVPYPAPSSVPSLPDEGTATTTPVALVPPVEMASTVPPPQLASVPTEVDVCSPEEDPRAKPVRPMRQTGTKRQTGIEAFLSK